MAGTVDLMVVGVSDGKSRDELSEKLVREFGQPPQAFEPMLDAAFGDSGPYAAQSDVDRKLAEQGLQQLQSFGLVCAITGVGEGYEPDAVSSLAEAANETPASSAAIDDLSNEQTSAEDADDEIVELSSTYDPAAVKDAEEKIASIEEEPASEPEPVAGEPALDGSGRTDIPEALSTTSFDELEAELIDPAPVVKEKSAPVELDDGGLSISNDDSTPLTKPKAKSDPDAADDGGLSLVDAKRKLTMTSADDDEADNDAIGVVGAIESANVELPSLDESEETPPEVSLVEAAPVEEIEAIADDTANNDEPLQAPVMEDASSEEVSFDDLDDITSESEAVEESVPAIVTEVVEDTASAPTFDELDFNEPKADDTKTASVESAQPEANISKIEATDSAEEITAVEPAVEEPAVGEITAVEPVIEEPAKEAPSIEAVAEEPTIEKAAADEDSAGSISNLLADIQTKADAPTITGAPEIAVTNAEGGSAPEITQDDAPEIGGGKAPSGLVLPGQPAAAVVPKITPSVEIDGEPADDDADQLSLPAEEEVVAETQEGDEEKSKEKSGFSINGKTKKIAAVAAGLAIVAGAGTFAFKQSDGGFALPLGNSQAASEATDRFGSGEEELTDSTYTINDTASQQPAGQERALTLEDLTTEQLLTNLSVTSNESALVNLEPYFLESVDRARRGPQFGAAVPAESELLREIQNRVPHRADTYFDEWSDRESDLSLFLALLDNLIENDEYAVARQLSDRAKDKLFSVMSTQRLVRAYNSAGKKQELRHLMTLAARDTFMIKSAEERILAISDHAFTQAAIGNVDDSSDTFLKASILARTLPRAELQTVGLSSVARYMHRAGNEDEAMRILKDSEAAGKQLPRNTAASDLALRYIAINEAKMGLYDAALSRTKQILDPTAQVSAYHGIALAVEASGDDTQARRILNKAFRTGSKIRDKEEREALLAKVVLASESQ